MSREDCPSDATLREALRGESTMHSKVFGHLDSCPVCHAKIEAFVREGDPLVECLSHAKRLPETFRTGLQAAYGTRALAKTPSLSSGSVLGDYIISAPLGRGGMGEVYRAKQILLDREVAIKILPSAARSDPKSQRRFRDSIKLAGKLDHPHIVRSFDASEVDGTCYLAMELVEGLDVQRVLRQVNRLSIQNACEITRQAALGLAYGHQQRCIHRDIKPANLLLGVDGIVKITDFGLATLIRDTMATAELSNRKTMAGMLLGSLNYIAPEQLRDPTSVDQRADIFSLGCTLYRMLYGHTPQPQAPSPSDPAHPDAACDEADVPLGITNLLNRMLAPHVEDRPQDAGQIADALQPFCEGADLLALLQQAREAVDNPTQQRDQPAAAIQPLRRRMIGALVAVGGFSLAAGLLSLRQWTPPNPTPAASATATAEVSTTQQPSQTTWIVDDSEAELISVEGTTGWATSRLLVGHGGTHTYAEQGGKTVRWTFANLPVARYRIYASWLPVPREQAAEAAIYQVRSADTLLSTVKVNHQVPPGNRMDGLQWILLGEFEAQRGNFIVELDATHSQGATVRADAIRVEQIAAATAVDPNHAP